MRRQPPGDVAGNLQLAALWHQPKMAPRVLHMARYLGVPRIRSSMLLGMPCSTASISAGHAHGVVYDDHHINR